jgi:hypothetical protein
LVAFDILFQRILPAFGTSQQGLAASNIASTQPKTIEGIAEGATMSLAIVTNLSGLLAAQSRASATSTASSTPGNTVGLAIAVGQATAASSAFASTGSLLSQNLLSSLQSDAASPSDASASTRLSANRAYGIATADDPNTGAL